MKYAKEAVLTVAVGSRNAAKVGAVADAFGRVWPNVTITGAQVASGVSSMPIGDAECLTGARNRAHRARTAHDADFGVGLEGGVADEPSGLMLFGWVVVVDRDGVEGVACTVKTALPDVFAAQVRRGAELGPLIDQWTGEHNVRAKGGAAGLISGGLVTRRQKFAQAVAYALSPFVSDEMYGTTSLATA